MHEAHKGGLVRMVCASCDEVHNPSETLVPQHVLSTWCCQYGLKIPLTCASRAQWHPVCILCVHPLQDVESGGPQARTQILPEPHRKMCATVAVVFI